MRFVKPLDELRARHGRGAHDLLVTLEENAVIGVAPDRSVRGARKLPESAARAALGLPDRFIDHGDPENSCCSRSVSTRRASSRDCPA
jgi:1-deoxy-D-xylulose-5-phosphate synthase